MKSVQLPRIDVKPVPLRGHSSFEKAIRAAEMAMKERAEEEQLIKGSTIFSYSSSATDLFLKLSTGRSVHISAGEDGVDWRLPEAEERCNGKTIPGVVELEFHSDFGIEQEPYVWKRQELLDSIVGAVISSLRSVDGLAYLMLKDTDDVMFTSSVITSDDVGCYLLFFSRDG